MNVTKVRVANGTGPVIVITVVLVVVFGTAPTTVPCNGTSPPKAKGEPSTHVRRCSVRTVTACDSALPGNHRPSRGDYRAIAVLLQRVHGRVRRRGLVGKQ
ncbi:hypothetical protein CBL_06261 [Carabus blaptoides fortunei]